jgi:hypothetical protein
MIGKTVAAITAALLLSTQVYAQTNQSPAPGVTSGPAAGTPTHMNSPQAGPLETQHQRDVMRDQSQSVRNPDNQTTPGKDSQTGAAGSSLPPGAPTR